MICSIASRQIKKNEGPMSNLKEKLILQDPDFMKYLSDPKVQSRLTLTSFGQRNYPEMRPTKFKIENDMIDYKTFTNSISRSKPRDLKPDIASHKYLDSIKTVSELHKIINPGNFDLDKNDELNRLQKMMIKPDDTKMTDQQLGDKIKTNEIKKNNHLEDFDNYLNIMLGRHLKFNEIEEAEIKKRKLEDLDLNHITEHFISK